MKKSTHETHLEQLLLVLASVIESRDSCTSKHVERVAFYARDIAVEIGLDESYTHEIYFGAMVHDIGKIGIKDAVLNKPSKLDPDEMTYMQSHTIMGHKILQTLDNLKIVSNIVLHHHERYDGTGYPDKLNGLAIPLEARIVILADYWDALTSNRSYRKALPISEALEIMHSEREKAFDPKLFDIFIGKYIFSRYIDSHG